MDIRDRQPVDGAAPTAIATRIRLQAPPSDEAALIDAATSGDAAAFVALHDRYVERVYRYVYYRVTNRADAEDLTQEVFLRAWRAIPRHRRTGASFFAWLIAIAHNLVIGWYRRPPETRVLDFEPVAHGNGVDPEVEALAQLDREAIHQAIHGLKPEHQHVVIMRFIEQLDYVDIAAALGKNESNVRVMVHRALVALRRLLAPEVRG